MTYTTKFCPHCDHMITLMDSAKHRYGSPFQVCTNCGNVYVDKSFRELAFMHKEKQTPKKLDPFNVVSFFIGIVFFLLTCYDYSQFGFHGSALLFLFGALIFLFCSISSTISDIRSYDHRCQLYEEELLKSLYRVTDPDYLKALDKIGYKIPSEYRQFITD